MNYNYKQQLAIDGNDKYKVIIAPAGSGKTSTLVGAIDKYYIENPNDHIVAITFTRKASAELKDRIGEKPNIEVSTIHSWSWKRLQELANEFGFKVQLLEDEAIKDILKQLSKNRRQYYLNQFQLFSYVMGNYNIDIDDTAKKIFETIRCDYIKFKKRNLLYDFTDLPEYLLDKLTEFSQRIINIDALFVDEFQDIDPIQLQLFDLVDSKRKCYIGDPRQAIYQFRGAVEEVFEKLDNFMFYGLTINYRSYQEILNYASTLRQEGLEAIMDDRVIQLTDIENLSTSEIECIRKDGGNVYNIPFIGQCTNLSNNTRQSDILVIKTLLQNKKTQILCRANKQVKKLQALGIDNVSTIHQAKGLEYDNVILIDFPCDTIEELNIAYVGATRAKNNLCIINFEVLLYIICQEDIKSNKKLF